jgi:hypothetical protein
MSPEQKMRSACAQTAGTKHVFRRLDNLGSAGATSTSTVEDHRPLVVNLRRKSLAMLRNIHSRTFLIRTRLPEKFEAFLT